MTDFAGNFEKKCKRGVYFEKKLFELDEKTAVICS